MYWQNQPQREGLLQSARMFAGASVNGFQTALLPFQRLL